MLKNIPRLNIRFRQYRMSGRWIDSFPEHEKLDPDLIKYNHTLEASDFIRYWEQLFYEPFHEVPEVSTLLNDLDLNGP